MQLLSFESCSARTPCSYIMPGVAACLSGINLQPFSGSSFAIAKTVTLQSDSRCHADEGCLAATAMDKLTVAFADMARTCSRTMGQPSGRHGNTVNSARMAAAVSLTCKAQRHQRKIVQPVYEARSPLVQVAGSSSSS